MSAKAGATLAKRLKSEDHARRLVLSLFFRAVLGIQRIFHFETITDKGFAILTGGEKVLSRVHLGSWARAVSTPAVKAFTRATERLGALRANVVTLSVDEHAVARWTRKFRIQKGFHAIRNRHMRVEKLVFLHWPAQRRFLLSLATRGKTSLAALAIGLLRTLRARVRPRQVRVILDAAASARHADLCALDRFRATVFLIRAPRRPSAVRAWKRLPREAFIAAEDPGRFVGAKAKEIAIAETTTTVPGIATPVRTLVVRENAASGKHRWHTLYILHDPTTPPLDLLQEYRTRQHHEQGHRIGVHDLALDAVPSGYPKHGRPDRPGFRHGPIQLASWIAALSWDALRELSLSLPKRLHLAHPRTLRRWVLERNAELFLTRSHLLIVLDSTRGLRWLLPLVRKLNDIAPELPWLGSRRVAMGFVAPRRPPDARPLMLPIAETGRGSFRRYPIVWC
ncbi:MAG TPA: hypothetical protein VN253_27150 [Kofleriaceae bacterium]|nr:hypothetical protein [Kofleriaceae bacterium]